MTIHAIDLEQADEADLTIEQKVMLLWKAIMGYGYGTGRVPGILEQIRETQKIALWGLRILIFLVTTFGVLITHSEISNIWKALVGLFH